MRLHLSVLEGIVKGFSFHQLFQSNEELEREARQIIEELERDSKDTPLDAQLQLLKAKYDEGKISSQEFKRARVLLMYSQSMIDTEKAEQELKKAHKILVELREVLFQ